jgi:hypothetical protein
VGRKIPKQKPASAIPKYIAPPKDFRPVVGEGLLRIRLGRLDVKGPWCLSEITAAHLQDLLARISSLETMQCSDLFAPGSEEGKKYPVAKLPNKSARDRLVEIDLDDATEIARLRISGERRLYGFLPDGGPDFYALWWDPKHEIWPSTKRNT